MSPSPSEARPLESPGLVFLGSLVIAGHLLAVVVAVLAAPSGPWVTPEGGIVPAAPGGMWVTPGGTGMAPAPQFALALHRPVTSRYLWCLKLEHSFRFSSNLSGPPGVSFEVRLKDKDGQILKTVRYPDAGAGRYVRHRQTLLAQWLAPDQPVPPPQGESIAAPGRQVRTVAIWDMAGEEAVRIREVPEHLVPRDRDVLRPTDWSLILGRAYARYLCRKHGAASAEFIRFTRPPPHPDLLFMDNPPPGAFGELIADYGEVSR